ncbi:SIR2 family NAD-dependent protein deacylase [Flavobacteriaceae bacterium 14752]|uniref:SIR2 family NAD-dependent protein deacylase n=1 Tax=Mesohalobacter salilacus TaxID=2491711 RepID=UPI000F62D4C4|nr:NAD-dependent deacylase [Flavobacteriaceae bacterium 14752]
MSSNKNKIVILSGAGVSAESGLKTFRDADGLWEGHDVTEVATPQAFEMNPHLVLDFYNQRRRQLKTVNPNKAHQILADLEEHFDVEIITQNVDDLHERAGSTKVTHLHGELFKVRPVNNPNRLIEWRDDLQMGDTDDKGHQLRPHVVWFGEAVPMMEKAIEIVETADILIIIGTSLQVYPAAGLMDYAKPDIPVYLIDPKPGIKESAKLRIFAKSASAGMEELKSILLKS